MYLHFHHAGVVKENFFCTSIISTDKQEDSCDAGTINNVLVFQKFDIFSAPYFWNIQTVDMVVIVVVKPSSHTIEIQNNKCSQIACIRSQ